VNRARLLAEPGEDLDKVIDATHGVRHAERAEFWPPKPAPAAKTAAPATAKPATPAKPAAPKPAAASPAPAAAQPPKKKSLLTRLRSAVRDQRS